MKFFTILLSTFLLLNITAIAQNPETKKEITESDAEKINEFVANDNLQGAIQYIDEVIKRDKKNACELLTTKALLFVSLKEYDKGVETYEATLKKCKNNERAIEGVAIAYILQAQELKDEASQTTSKEKQKELDEKARDLYLKSLPHLNKQRKMIKKRTADKYEVKSLLMKLQNVYYNLILLNVDKEKEFQKIEQELGKP